MGQQHNENASIATGLLREARFFALMLLIGLAAYPLANGISSAREAWRAAQCDAMRQMVEGAKNVALAHRQSAVAFTQDHRWNDSTQWAALSDHVTRARQTAAASQDKADRLGSKLVAMKCER